MQKVIYMYTDGACIPNPGEMAAGIVLLYGSHAKEIGKKIGQGTNNVAELTAIKIGLESIKNKSIPVQVISDSMYALNSISGKWNGVQNRELIQSIKDILGQFDSVSFKWVRGHNGDRWQERAHELASQF